MSKLFNGSSDYYSVGNGNTFTFTKIFSLWLKLDAFPASEACLYARYTVTLAGSFHRYVGVFVSSAGQLSIRQFYSDSMGVSFSMAVVPSNISTGTWHHVMTMNNNIYRAIWLDGVFEDDNSSGVTGSFYREIWVGARKTPTDYFDGYLLDVAEWEDDNITTAEIDKVSESIYSGYYSPQFFWPHSMLYFFPFYSDHAFNMAKENITLTKSGTPADAEHLPILYPEDNWIQYKSRETGMQGWDPQLILPERRKLIVVEY